MAFLEIRGVTRRFGEAGDPATVEVLKGVDLALEKGESAAVVGPSGSGKSTLLNLVGALDAPTSGKVLLEGRDIASLGEAERAKLRNLSLGFVFQLHHLLPQCTVLENVLVPYAAGHARGPFPEVRDRAVSLLERVGLASRMDAVPAQLSGGERSRTALVRALALRPVLVLADEPTGSLDAESARATGELLVELNREEGVTLLAATHAEDLAGRMGKIYELRDGRLVPREETAS